MYSLLFLLFLKTTMKTGFNKNSSSSFPFNRNSFFHSKRRKEQPFQFCHMASVCAAHFGSMLLLCFFFFLSYIWQRLLWLVNRTVWNQILYSINSTLLKTQHTCPSIYLCIHSKLCLRELPLIKLFAKNILQKKLWIKPV